MKKGSRRIKLKRKQYLFRSTNKGYITFILLGLAVAALFFAGSFVTSNTKLQDNNHYILVSPTPYGNYKSLELHTLRFTTVAPTVQASLCQNRAVNEEPWILLAYSPSQGQTVGANGQVKVWVSDEAPPCVGTGETVDATGLVTTRGNTTEKASNGYLWEPALYVDTFAENGGTPHFPDSIKGTFNNGSKSSGSCENLGNIGRRGGNGGVVNGPAMDPVPSHAPAQEPEYQDEYIWNVSSLGLATGTHQAEFVIHDGDVQYGVGCVNIAIQ